MKGLLIFEPSFPRLKVYTTYLSEDSLNKSMDVGPFSDPNFFVGVSLGVCLIEPEREPCTDAALELTNEPLWELN